MKLHKNYAIWLSKEIIHDSWFKSGSFSDSIHNGNTELQTPFAYLAKSFDYQLSIFLNMSDVHLGNSLCSEPAVTHQASMGRSF